MSGESPGVGGLDWWVFLLIGIGACLYVACAVCRTVDSPRARICVVLVVVVVRVRSSKSHAGDDEHPAATYLDDEESPATGHEYGSMAAVVALGEAEKTGEYGGVDALLDKGGDVNYESFPATQQDEIVYERL